MAKKSSIEKNNRRARLAAQHLAKRDRLKAVAKDKSVPIEERFLATVTRAKMPRNGARIRVRNRCELTGRPRGVYRKFKISRIALRDLGSTGQIPGVVKSSCRGRRTVHGVERSSRGHADSDPQRGFD